MGSRRLLVDDQRRWIATRGLRPQKSVHPCQTKKEGEAFGVRPSEKVEGASPSKHTTEGGACELIIYEVNCVVSTQFFLRGQDGGKTDIEN